MAVDDLLIQAGQIVADLKNSGIEASPTSYMVAMIAYMHKLGKDIGLAATPNTESNETGE